MSAIARVLSFRGEVLTQSSNRPMQPDARGVRRDVEDDRYLPGGELFPRPQVQQFLVLRRKSRERLIEIRIVRRLR